MGASLHDIPAHWIRGQLLDLRRFTDGSFLATALGEEYKPELANGVRFDSSFEAQSFVSAWYDRPSIGGVHG